jgi:hypothetical protein
MTDTNAPITDGFLEGEVALSRINRQDKTYLPAQEGNPPALCAIVEPFMLGTIPEFHAHLFLYREELSRAKTFSTPCVSEEIPRYLKGTNGYAWDEGTAQQRWPHVGKWFPTPGYRPSRGPSFFGLFSLHELHLNEYLMA